ncbi:hypothetical protein KXX57_007401, partial [Aspergillus fumigatus]
STFGVGAEGADRLTGREAAKIWVTGLSMVYDVWKTATDGLFMSATGRQRSADISQDLQHALVDEYANERHPTDGEVYRKIRQYQHESNALFQNRWWSRLSPNKAKRLRQLFSQENTFICAGFDALLPIPGLWKGMSLGSLNSVFALKCDEEIVHYLRVIWTFWAALANHDRTWMARIDTHTVDELQLYAPRASKVDWTTVKGKILSGEVFSNFSRSERASIWENLRSKEACDGIIPSLHTFFRDISYLELCANAVKRLVVLNKQRPTVRSALVHSFRPRHGDGDYLVQTSETTFRRQRGSTTECITSGYRQIWMYAMRHYPDMAKDVQCGHLKANPARAKARAKADESVIHDMAALAQKLGFRTPQIKEILKQSPDRQIARATLLKARKPDRYHYDSETFESLVDRIVGCFVLAIPNESQPTMALVTGQAPKLHDRCGTPQEQAQKLDRPHLFMDRLHAETVRQKNLSSLEGIHPEASLSHLCSCQMMTQLSNLSLAKKLHHGAAWTGAQFTAVVTDRSATESDYATEKRDGTDSMDVNNVVNNRQCT